MYKGLLIVAVLLFSSFCAQAQKYSTSNSKAIKSYQNALTAYDAKNSTLALDLLDEALKREAAFPEAHLLKFEIYADAGKLELAADALRDAIKISPDFFPNAYFFLGSLELKFGNYESAKKQLLKYSSYRSISPDIRAKAMQDIETCEYAIEAMKHPVPFDPKNMGAAINTAMPEYYPCLTADGRTLLYTRLVDDPQAFRGKNEEFFVSRYEDGEWQTGKPLLAINTPYNEGAPSISADGRILVFTACEIMGDYGPGRKGYGSCDLFIAYRQGNNWSQPENMGPAVNTRNWETQPSLSADGNTLYFIRGIQGSGGMKDQDIYVTRRLVDDSWSKPVALPQGINTPGKEESVMIHPDGRTLYFASNGHLGMGGMDLYVTRKNDKGEWGRPENLGYPINTHNDENSLTVFPSGDIALFASDRKGGFGDLDLYSFTLPVESRPVPVTYAEGVVVDDKSGKPVGAALELYDLQEGDTKLSFNADAQSGTFLIALPTGRTYGLSVKAEGYLFHSETFALSTPEDSQPYAIEVRLKKPVAGSAIVLRNVFFDTDKDLLKAESLAEIGELSSFLSKNPKVKIEISGHTDNAGDAEYNLKLSERRAKAVKSQLVDQYAIDASRISTRGYGQQKPIASNDTEEGRALNRRTEFMVLE